MKVDPEPAEGATKRHSPWRDVPDERWNDWRWQMRHRLNTLEELRQVINLTPDEIAGVTAKDRFRLDITPYFAALMDRDDPNCPIRRQIVPTAAELQQADYMMEDSLGEDRHSPVPGLVHRYPDRVLMLVTTQCATYCRYCTRSRIVGDPHENFNRKQLENMVAYIARTTSVRDVLISGGDPLTLAPKTLDWVLGELRAIPHVEIIRIGSRVPVFMPMRIDDELINTLRKYHPLWMNVHINHYKEITPELGRALGQLADAGIPLGNQSVLLAGVNDCPNIIKRLSHDLLKNRVRPYYLYQCDLVEGAGHFRTSVSKGIEIMEALRGHTTGFAIPTYVIDAPGGGGKVPVMPNYLVSQSPERVVVRNFEGVLAAYDQPTDYKNHDARTCADCRAAQEQKSLQDGVSGLLAGDRLTIVPEGYQDLHRRGRTEPNTVEELLEIAAKRANGNGNGQPVEKEPIWQRVS
ncbi:MAG: lysine 2,3-aminomutase [Chloroflexi bacterium]|nr:lysine 2,3-aminomutase [Chloroflexota bacterium]